MAFSPTLAQAQIRDAQELNLLVIAPAGCGKTEAMALRVAGLIRRTQVSPPRKILVTTFSNRARDNIRARIGTQIGESAMRRFVTVANFHGLSARIIRAHGKVIGLDPSFDLPESDWVAEQCRKRNLSFIQSGLVKDALRDAKQRTATDAQVMQLLTTSGVPEAVQIEQARIIARQLTYDDLPRLAELILQSHGVARLYQSHFACVIVDEFQDLTEQQLRIIEAIGWQRTTFAGDVAQGIYSFAGAAPAAVLNRIQTQSPNWITLSESHRSSPAVIAAFNALTPATGGTPLTCAVPTAWSDGGIAAMVDFPTADDEAAWVRRIAAAIHSRASLHRVGVIARTAGRRRFVDAEFSRASSPPSFRWDDPTLDTEAATVTKALLANINPTALASASDPFAYLRAQARLEGVDDPSTRQAVAEAIAWAYDLIRDGKSITEIRSRIRVGRGDSILTAPGAHLLTAHLGKGQQFDWVVVVGLEEGYFPYFEAKSEGARDEELRLLSVAISRARHGIVLSRARIVPSMKGQPLSKDPSSFLPALSSVCLDQAGLVAWLKAAAWSSLTPTSDTSP